MKEISKVVKSKGQPDVPIKVKQAETVKECVELAGGEKELIAKFNSQFTTDKMNATRKPVADPVAKAVSKALKDPAVPKETKDALLATLKKHNINI